MRSAECRPQLPAYIFPTPSSQKQAQQATHNKRDKKPRGDTSKEQGASAFNTSPETLEDDEFGDDDFKDLEVIDAGIMNFLYSYYCPHTDTRYTAEEIVFSHIDDFSPVSTERILKPSVRGSKAAGTEESAWSPERLENGKWACNHKCKDKTT